MSKDALFTHYYTFQQKVSSENYKVNNFRIYTRLTGVRYIIIDEMSMVGRKFFGEIDKRLRHVFPHTADEVLGNYSCLLFFDFDQLPPVMDLPLCSSDVRSALSELGRTAYQSFTRAIVLTQVVHQAGQDSE